MQNRTLIVVIACVGVGVFAFRGLRSARHSAALAAHISGAQTPADPKPQSDQSAPPSDVKPAPSSAAPAVSGAPAPFKPVSSVHGLMHGQSLLFKELQAAVMKPGGAHDLEHVEAYAEALAELANVNTFNNDKEDYRGWAGKVRDASMELAKAAAHKPPDVAKMKELVGAIRNTCSACHDVYRK